jgi:hypothetical protein
LFRGFQPSPAEPYELYDDDYSTSWAGYVASMITGRNPYDVFVWKPAGERLFGRPRRRLENNIKIGLV